MRPIEGKAALPGRDVVFRPDLVVGDGCPPSGDTEGTVDDLLFTQFADKVTILKKSAFLARTDRPQLVQQLQAIQRLRDSLAHANEYAATQNQARRVCRIVRSMLDVHRILSAELLRGD